MADDDEVRSGDEDNEHPANAPTRTNAASFEMTAIVSGSLWAPGKTPACKDARPTPARGESGDRPARAATQVQEPQHNNEDGDHTGGDGGHTSEDGTHQQRAATHRQEGRHTGAET